MCAAGFTGNTKPGTSHVDGFIKSHNDICIDPDICCTVGRCCAGYGGGCIFYDDRVTADGEIIHPTGSSSSHSSAAYGHRAGVDQPKIDVRLIIEGGDGGKVAT